jgi:hypothetical protein
VRTVFLFKICKISLLFVCRINLNMISHARRALSIVSPSKSVSIENGGFAHSNRHCQGINGSFSGDFSLIPMTTRGGATQTIITRKSALERE